MGAKKATAKKKRAAAASRAVIDPREVMVILEDLRSQMQVVVETVTSLSSTFESKLADLRADLGERIARLEDAVRQHSRELADLKSEVASLKSEVASLKSEVASLKSEVASLRHDFDHRQELARMTALEERIARVEAKLGLAS